MKKEAGPGRPLKGVRQRCSCAGRPLDLCTALTFVLLSPSPEALPGLQMEARSAFHVNNRTLVPRAAPRIIPPTPENRTCCTFSKRPLLSPLCDERGGKAATAPCFSLLPCSVESRNKRGRLAARSDVAGTPRRSRFLTSDTKGPAGLQPPLEALRAAAAAAVNGSRQAC